MELDMQKGKWCNTPMMLVLNTAMGNRILIYNKKGCMTRYFERTFLQDKKNHRKNLENYK